MKNLSSLHMDNHGWGNKSLFYPQTDVGRGYMSDFGGFPDPNITRGFYHNDTATPEEDYKNGVAYDLQHFLTKAQNICKKTYPNAAKGKVGGKKKAYMECMDNAQKNVNAEAKRFADSKSDQNFNQTITAVLGSSATGSAVDVGPLSTGQSAGVAGSSGTDSMGSSFILFVLLALILGGGFYMWKRNQGTAQPLQPQPASQPA